MGDGISELIIDNFAGGGGASTGIAMALGRSPDIAINHDPQAVAMHKANHPETEHHCEDVWEVSPRALADGRPVGLMWLSPDCKHHSKAKGGKPVEKKIRGLAWVALRWIAQAPPRIIILENVEEFADWGPLIEGPDGKMRPCKQRKGQTFQAFVNAIRKHGYMVEWRELRACDYGAPTIRKRLFLVARRDGQPIIWPAPTHGDPKSEAVRRGKLLPWRTAAECLNFSLPCHSIFLTKEQGRAVGVNRPLAEATLRRIAKGIMRYVVNAASPFIVSNTAPFITKLHAGAIGSAIDEPLHTVTAGGDISRPAGNGHAMGIVSAPLAHMGHGEQSANGRRRFSHGVRDIEEPLNTITASGATAGLVSAFLSTYYGDKRPTDARGIHPESPLPTQTTENRHGLVSATLVKHYGGGCTNPCSSMDLPLPTITATDHNSLVTSNLIKLRGDNVGQPASEPLATISAQGTHHAEVRAFLVKYYGAGEGQPAQDPVHTVTTLDRFGLVTVSGQDYAIVDIGLRMLQPRELFRAQGFPDTYIIGDKHGQGLTLTKTAQVRMAGNSVCPPLAAALVSVNFGCEQEKVEEVA